MKPKLKAECIVQVEDVDYKKVSAFNVLLQEQRKFLLALRDIKGDTAKDNKRRLSILNKMEMCEAKFSELMGKGDIFKGIRTVQMKLLHQLAKRNAKNG